MDPSEIAELKEARRASLVEKWASGKKLSLDEAEEIRDLVSPGRPQIGTIKWAKNKAEASKALGITRPTFDRVLKMPGCPERSTNGRYNIPAISEFMGSEGFQAGIAVRTDDLAADKRKIAKFEGLMAELKYRVAARELVHIEAVERVWGDQLQTVRNFLKESPDITDEKKGQLFKRMSEVMREACGKSLAGAAA